MYNKNIKVDGVNYELLFSFDSDMDLCNKRKELENFLNPNDELYFDNSWKNQLQYFNEDKSITVYCIDYRYGFKAIETLNSICQVVDEYIIYKRIK